MSAQGLPAGAKLTTIDGRRCTAVPRAASSSSIETTAPTTTTFSSAITTNTAPQIGVADIDNAGTTVAETELLSSTSTPTSSSLVSITTTSTLVPTQATQASVEEETLEVPPVQVLPALASTPLPPPPAALPSTASSSTTTALPASSVVTSLQQPVQTPLAQTQSSQADNNLIAPPADTVTSSQATAVPDVSASPALTDGTAAAPLFTTIGTQQASTNDAVAEATGSTNSAASVVTNPNSNAVQSTVAVAGGVIGGVVAISFVAFIVWWWRRRVVRKRRSTLLTPLDAVPSFDRRDQKGSYMISRGSIGPTPMGEKFKAALGYNVKKFRGRMSHMVTKSTGGSSSVNLDRGNSQFMDPGSTHSRANSGGALTGSANVTAKDRFLDWWTRLTADMKFNWRLRDKNPNMDDFSIVNGSREKKPSAVGSQPDFLTLLGMDDRELDREAQRRRASISRKNGSAGSGDHFLSGLNLNFGSPNDDPFSDANALAHASAQPAPLVVSQSNNPFSDTNAIRDQAAAMGKPNTYVADIRRSRGQSVSTNTNRQPSTLYNNRESSGSVGSFAARRDKFRSDPFDLERPELLAGARQAKNSITSSTAGTAGSRTSRGGVGTGDLRRPPGAHTRSESFSSKYSSGVSMGDWSDPGPDVGPAAARGWDGPEPRESPTQGWRDRLEREAATGKAPVGQRKSDGSEKSVGKAM
ncbi:hypothetical protein B0H66DRAFT_367012 [Apodospora peruviana]|uniref:Uncharacterized protein n=1 Tax=Apodospora peruviana TaxID=516989 RepID=A0AAE0M0R4_9PEZI|nr:hypothetical protein B0H66DRAFT_367012 [Apodospora peruviana]